MVPVAATAQPLEGLYVSGATGANFAGSLTSATGHTVFQTNAGPLGIAALGWAFGNGIRTEIEGSYRSNGVAGVLTRRVSGNMLPLGNVSGTAATGAVMVNAVYDLSLERFGVPLRPYIGGGIGYGRLSFKNTSGQEPFLFTLPNNLLFGAPATQSYGNGGAFAYQAIAGVAMPLAFVPGLEATLEYRYFATTRATIGVTTVPNGTFIVNGTPVSGSQNSAGLVVRDHAVLAGLRYTFGVPKI